MRNDLVAEEVEIDPFVSGSALLASKLMSIERARFGEIANGKGEMKTGPCWHQLSLWQALGEDQALPAKGSPFGTSNMGKKAPSRSRRRRPPQPPQRKLLKIDGEPVPVTLKLNRRARQLIVRVNPSTGEVVVVAPSRRSLAHAMEFARKQSDWIAQRLENVPEPIPVGLGRRILYRGKEHVIRYGEAGRRPVWIENGGEGRIIRVNGRSEHAARRVIDFLKGEARRVLDARAMYYAELLDVKPARVTVRDTSSRWGSCSSTRNLSFSWRLILAPPYVLEYVVAHEIAHLREMNHGRRFWRLVEELVGNVERPQAWLNDNGAMLHRYAPRMVTE